jgi:hypothetical protein
MIAQELMSEYDTVGAVADLDAVDVRTIGSFEMNGRLAWLDTRVVDGSRLRARRRGARTDRQDEDQRPGLHDRLYAPLASAITKATV